MKCKVKLDSKDISSRMVARLTEYLEILYESKKYSDSINSIDIAEKMNGTAAQVRRDFSTFGEFGMRGRGYNTESLITIIEHILGIDENTDLALIGYGKMGSMIAGNNDVLGKGFNIVGIFDKDDSKIGKIEQSLNLEVQNISNIKNFINSKKINQVILAVTKDQAQSVANELIDYGVKGILNLTSCKIEAPKDVAIIEVNISASLQELNFWRRQLSKK